jgi:hypothetical protein
LKKNIKNKVQDLKDRPGALDSTSQLCEKEELKSKGEMDVLKDKLIYK